MRKVVLLALCATLSGCVTAGETVSFRPSNPNQQAMMRDGRPALVSRQKSSLVLVSPAARQQQTYGRPVFVVGINNIGRQPVDFRVAQVEAIQHVGGSDFSMPIVTYEMLVQEEMPNRVPARYFSDEPDLSPFLKGLHEVRQMATRDGWCYWHVRAII